MAKKQTQTRPPIVTIMGHVDHGKTTLLDAIRSSNITAGESGGITQHIGAYQITHQGNPITFIDTPGHAAFSQMRSRGAEITDIVILVVAANDGVKPQTVESIKHIQAAEVPIIVAINKIDLQGASAEMVKAQLTEHQIFCEGYGGQTPAVELSALKGEGIEELLEMINLVAELEELEADPHANVEAVIIETQQDEHKGSVATAIVLEGTLTSGDGVYYFDDAFNIRALIDDQGKQVEKAEPGKPVEVLGFNQTPEVATKITGMPYALEEVEDAAITTVDEVVIDMTLTSDDAQSLALILRADTTGTLEAIKQNVADEVHILSEAVAPISTSDILLSQTTGALIVGFNVQPTNAAKRLANIESVPYKTYSIIYELLEFLEQKVLRILEPTIDEEDVGEAEIIALFEINKDTIAGCKVKSGSITKAAPMHLIRDGEIVKDLKVKSLKQAKDDVPEVKKGAECGVAFHANVDLQVGDVLKSYKKIDLADL